MDHVCSFDDVPVIEEEVHIKCSCGYAGWFKDTADALIGMQDHEQISRGERKRRRIAPLDRKVRDKVLAMDIGEPAPQPGVLVECGCSYQHRVPKPHLRRACFVCGKKRKRASLVENNTSPFFPRSVGADGSGVHLYFAGREDGGLADATSSAA